MNIYQQFGCEVNSVEVEILFEQYLNHGFLYESKLRSLARYLPEIQENWRRMLLAGERLMRIVSFKHPDTRASASICDWRSTNTGWCSQHLVSSGDPIGSRAVMLSEQMRAQSDPLHQSSHNWFRPENRLPMRVFGSIASVLPSGTAVVLEMHLLHVTLESGVSDDDRIVFVECGDHNSKELVDLAYKTRGKQFCQAEELSHVDFCLSKLDCEYQQVGLRRYRRAWLAVDKASDCVVGAIIANRGPLGINFSYLENRAELLISMDVNEDLRSVIIAGLIRSASSEYSDFAPGIIPIITDAITSKKLISLGNKFVREYCRSIWLKDGYEAWFRHVDGFYSRIQNRLDQRHSTSKSRTTVPVAPGEIA